MAAPTVCKSTIECIQESNLILADIRAHLDNSVPITTTTLTAINNGSIMQTILLDDASVWLTGVVCGIIFILGWRAADI